ncbi:MAG: hypothetical protein K8T89_06480, partial [Planctomycetes bacterium]|nr:hypothetical protein [Planctomycetota bacterium]
MFRLPRSWRRSILALAAFGGLWWNGSASATTFTVLNVNDSGAGSLRDAITNANATAGPHQINFAANVTGTISLASPLPILGQSMSINGPGASVLTVSGNNTTRVFFADIGTSTISGLTVFAGNATGGRGADTNAAGGGGGGGMGAGGGLYINRTASVTLSGVVFRSNRAVGGTGGNSSGAFSTNVVTPFAAGGGGGGLGGNGGAGGVRPAGSNPFVFGAGGGGGLYGNGGNNVDNAAGGGGGQVFPGGDDGVGTSGGGGGGGITSAGQPGTAGGAGGGPPGTGGDGGGGFTSDGNPGGYGGGGGG